MSARLIRRTLQALGLWFEPDGRILDRGTVDQLTERSSLFRELTGGLEEEPLFVPEDEEALA